MNRLGLLALLLIFALGADAPGFQAPSVLEGDVVFRAAPWLQNEAVRRALRTQYGHAGVVILHDGNLWVLEAAGKDVKFTQVERWFSLAQEGHCAVKRLRGADRLFSPEAMRRLRERAEKFDGLDFDPDFNWASEDKLYCSELIWKLYDSAFDLKLCALPKLGDYDLSIPLVRTAIEARFGGEMPVGEILVTPGAIFDSPLLETISER